MYGKDRGLRKWNPVGFLQQQNKMLKEIYEKPIFDDYELEEINTRLLESLEMDVPLYLKIYEKGHLKEFSGVVSRIDPYQRVVRIQGDSGAIKTVKFHEIIGADA